MILLLLSCLFVLGPGDCHILVPAPVESDAKGTRRAPGGGRRTGAGRMTGSVPAGGAIRFEPGELTTGETLSLRDGSGSPLPADFIVTGRWRDGSVRAVAIRTVLRSSRAGERLRLLVGRKECAPPTAIAIDRSERGGTIDTGPLRLAFANDGSRFFTGGSWRGRGGLLEEGLGLTARIGGGSFRPAVSHVLVDEGRAWASVLFRGRLVDSDRAAGPLFLARFRFFAGSGRIDCVVRIEGDGDLEGTATGVVLDLRPPWKSATAPVCVHFGGEPIGLTPQRGCEVVVRSRPGLVEVLGSEEESIAGSTAGDARILLKGCSPRVAVDLPRFGRLHPWSAHVCAGGAFSLSLLNDRFEWEPGLACERRFRIVFHGRGEGLDAACRPTDAGPVFMLPVERARRALLFSPGSEGREDDPLRAVFLEMATDLIARQKAEWRKWDGFMDYGDYRKSYGIWANLEYDPSYGLLQLFLCTGDTRHLAAARTMLDHWLLYDRAGPDDPDASPGTPWLHGRAHRSGRSEAGHMWLDGLLLFHRITGEGEYRDAALKMGEILAGKISALEGTGLERNVAWPLAGLCSLVAAGEDRFRPAMKQAAALLRSRQLGSGLFGFRTTRCEDMECYEVNTWVTAGISVEALYRHFLVSGDERSQAAACDAMGALRDLAFDRSKQRFSQRLFLARDGGDLVARSGRVTAGKGALLGLGAARGFLLTGDGTWRERARILLSRALTELRADPPAFPGEDLAVILRAGPGVICLPPE